MFGAVIGDIIGSTREFSHIKTKEFSLFPRGSEFTDDSIMTIAVGDALMEGLSKGGDLHKYFVDSMQRYGRKYSHPLGAYGREFANWLRSNNSEPYNSCGNGSAMRVSPCALVARSLDEALDLAKQSAEVTHNHPEGIKGAQATAAAIYLAQTGATKEEIAAYIRDNYYQMRRTLDEIRPKYHFEGSCQKSVPQSIVAFLESTDYEDAIRNTISLGGDADTMGAITGSIAWAYYGRDGITPKMAELWKEASKHIPEELIERVIDFQDFCRKLAENKDVFNGG